MPINLSVFCDVLKLSSIKKEMVKLYMNITITGFCDRKCIVF